MEVCPNIPAGLFDGFVYEEQQIGSIDGKLLFLYTDGLTEAEDGGQRQYGEERLLGQFGSIIGLKAKEIVKAIEESVSLHANGAEQSDDLTMMAMKIKVHVQF